MIASALTLGLVGLATASPLLVRSPAPATSKAQGFNLVVNLTDATADFSPSIQHNFITTIHTGAGLALVGVNAEKGPIFYQNGTAEDQEAGRATIVADLGTPETPAGFKLGKDDAQTANLDFGPGTPGVQLSTAAPYLLQPQSYLACNESLEYYHGEHFIVIKHADAEKPDVPDNCAAVTLLPQCADLKDLSKDAFASHAFVLESQCYDSVAEPKLPAYSS